MNKVKLKKRIDSDKLKNLLAEQHFIGFFCSQNLTVNERVALKKELVLDAMVGKKFRTELI